MRVGIVWSVVVLVLAGCSSGRGPAPVENRAVGKSTTVPVQRAGALPSSATSAPAPDGFYRVRKGDTLIGISLDHGVAWRDLAAWNQIDNPNLIEVDQLLRVKPPASARVASNSGGQTQGAAEKTASAEPRPMEIRPIAPGASGGQGGQAGTSAASGSVAAARPSSGPPPQSSTQAPGPQTSAAQPSAQSQSSASRPASDAIGLSWPSSGRVITQFAEPGYKGIAISGAEGDPILAAGDGRVVYSGSGLRGYGNLVIVKHDGDFLTAYAHNKTILVTEGQTVKRGQKIAELGRTDSDIPKLHFEVRRSGKPVDPLKYLAQR